MNWIADHTTADIVSLTLWVLMLFSIVSWSLILMQAWMRWRDARNNRDFTRHFWQARDLTDARRLAQTAQGPVARVGRAGFEILHVMEGERTATLQDNGDRHEVLERRLRDAVRMTVNDLESGLTVLASIGSTAPFIGLFGTVWGIMRALHDISLAGSAGLDVVAGPIGEALVATAIGIATAIPAVLAFNHGLRKVRLYATELDAFANDFLRLAQRPASMPV
jgi:biopolymer transport protein ExbB